MLQIQTCNGLPASFKRTIARLLEVVKCSKTKAKKSLKQSLIYVNDIWNKSYMNCGNEMKMKKWSSQWTQFMQLHKEAWKKFRTSTGFEPVTSRCRCDALTNWAMKPLTLGAGQLWVHMFPWKKPICSREFFSGFFTQLHKLRSLRRSFLHFHFISAVHIWFISYIINTHFFHGNIWTHNWPAPNVSGFIAQLVEDRTGKSQGHGFKPCWSPEFFFRLLYAIA